MRSSNEECGGNAILERLNREADFHDRVFGTETNVRAPTDRFYAVAQRAYNDYASLVRENIAGLDVLEYGCGPGSQAFDLASLAAQVYGIDISPAAIEAARATAVRRNVGHNCHFEVMDAEAMSFPDDRFDRICGSGILHHLDLTRAFGEIARILKPGGRAIFIEPLGHNPAINWYRRRTPQMRTPDEHPLLVADFAKAGQHFPSVRQQFYSFAVLAAVPLLRSRLFRPIHGALERLDSILLASRSPIRWCAWLAVMVLET